MLARSATLFAWAKANRTAIGSPPTLFHQLIKRWRSLRRKNVVATAAVEDTRQVGKSPRKMRPGPRVRADYPTERRW